MDTTVLYHGNCPDGFGAAFACWLIFGNEAQYLPVSYGQPCPYIPDDHTVYIVDFSYSAPILQALLAVRLHLGKSREPYVTVLDHHLSAQRDLASLARQDLRGLDIRFDLRESGASLTWKHLHGYRSLSEEGIDPGDMPLFFSYIRDRDLWQWQLPQSKAVSVALWSYPREFAAWFPIMADMETDLGFRNFAKEGQGILRYADRLVEEQAARVTWGTIGGHYVPIVNTTTLFSEVGDYLCSHATIPKTECTPVLFCAYYFDRADGQRQWGLRGHGNIDLSLVAQRYGGGGHRDAAGFVTAQDWREDVQIGDAPWQPPQSSGTAGV